MRNERRLALRHLASGVVLLTLGRAGRASAENPVIYTYDALGRLTSATYPNGVTITYSYDPAGNRTQVVAGSTPPPPPPPPPLSASASPTLVEGDLSTPAGPAMATAAGGAPPYVFAWERVSGSGFIDADDPGAAGTTWTYSGSPSGPPKTATWRCKVTDAASATAYTGSVQVRIYML